MASCFTIVKVISINHSNSIDCTNAGRNIKPPKGPIPVANYYVGNVPATPRLGLPSINLEDGPQGKVTLINIYLFIK